jgi:hypothetical protein
MKRQEQGYRTHDPAAQAKSFTFQLGLRDGQSDARLLAKGLQPVGMDAAYSGGWLYREGYSKGLNGGAG